jgi:acyl-CoA thioester hydrolase
MTRPPPSTRAAYLWFNTITTRWMDNDAYGHVNNVIYYAWFDTAVNRFLVDNGLLDIGGSSVVGVVAETGCRYRSQISYPDLVTVGLRVARLGTSSVRYETAVFRDEDQEAAAEGHFVHVYVDRATRRPVPIPEHVRTGLSSIAAST